MQHARRFQDCPNGILPGIFLEIPQHSDKPQLYVLGWQNYAVCAYLKRRASADPIQASESRGFQLWIMTRSSMACYRRPVHLQANTPSIIEPILDAGNPRKPDESMFSPRVR